MSEPVTAETIAKRLGLSRATVSIVLRGDAERRKISAHTTQRVLDAAAESNYVPNQAARMLRRQRTDVIGVIFPNFRFDWAERVMEGMLDVLDPTPYTPFVAMHRFDRVLFEKEVRAAMQRRDDALICHPLPGMGHVYTQMAQVGIPVVCLGDRPLDADNVNCVIWDSGSAAAVAVRHLIELGRKRIAFLGIDYPMAMSRARFEAYRVELLAAGLPMNEKWVFTPPSDTALEQIIEPGLDQFLAGPPEQQPDAIFVLNDGIALALVESLQRRHIPVPEQFAIASMGDLPMTAHAGLTTMREPVEQMGREAAEMILKLIADPKQPPLRRVLQCEELHARRTTLGDAWKPWEAG